MSEATETHCEHGRHGEREWCADCGYTPKVKQRQGSEPTDKMVDAAHAILSDPPYLKGDKRNTRNALRAALAAMSASQ